MPNNRDFFSHKKEWSKLKDQILSKYLVPYLAKITSSGRPTCIVDCFAGKGKFDDGQPGSPLIIAGQIVDKLEKDPDLDLRAIFIEKIYARDLKANLGENPHFEVIDGEYGDFIDGFISNITNPSNNYFFYVDPYGIKSLDFNHFNMLSALKLTSLEILINMNSPGFLREGCRILSCTRTIPDWVEDHESEDGDIHSKEIMDSIAGGDDWQGILSSFQNGDIDFHKAEELFMQSYTARLRSIFKHVVEIPIKQRSHHMPKYRLVFMTNYHDGLFLMSNQMNQAWHTMLNNESNGQLSLFSEEDLQEIEGHTIIDKIWDELDKPLRLPDLLSILIEHNGIAHTTSEYNNAIKLNDKTLFKVQRIPPKTRTGQESRSMDWKKSRITISRIPGN
jgi:three-Cys-motif partner protein